MDDVEDTGCHQREWDNVEEIDFLQWTGNVKGVDGEVFSMRTNWLVVEEIGWCWGHWVLLTGLQWCWRSWMSSTKKDMLKGKRYSHKNAMRKIKWLMKRLDDVDEIGYHRW